MTQETLLHDPSVTVDGQRSRSWQFDATPPALVRQLFAEMPDQPRRPNFRFLDPAAGHGCFGRCAAERWPSSHRIAIEPRDEAHEDLGQHYHESWVGRLQEVERRLDEAGPFDLIATNPPFSANDLTGIGALEFVELLHPRLSGYGQLWLFQLLDFGQRSKAGVSLFSRRPPAYCFRVPGSIGFRGDGGTDMRSYAWWGWKPGKTWTEMRTLPQLPLRERKWSVLPGTEWRHR